MSDPICPIWCAIIQNVGYKPHPWDNAREGTLTGVDDAVRAIRAVFADPIQWTPGEPPKRDGEVVYGHTWQPYRWKAYSPKSQQFRHGIKGRWQAMNEYGGWDNAKAPDEWAAAEVIEKRKEALTNV